MHRLSRWASAGALYFVPFVATAAPHPAVLYVPTEDVDLEPSGNPGGPCEDVSLAAYHSVLGCYPGLDAPTTFAVDPDAADLLDTIESALVDYDVHVTPDPPPAYLPALGLLLGADAELESTSWSCSAAQLNCASRRRNAIGIAYPETANCVATDLAEVGLYTFGRLSGAEGKTDTADHMLYPGDFSGAPRSWVDACDAVSQQLNEEGMALPIECVSTDHNGCAAGEVNSHADLLAYYGARVVDTEPPDLSNWQPTDGQHLGAPSGATNVTFSVDIADADPIVGVQFTIESPVFEPVFGGPMTICTNVHCDIYLLEGDPFKPTDGDWEFVVSSLPEGDYTFTIEASDYHGNVADPVVVTFSVGATEGTTGVGETGTTGGPDATGPSSASDPLTTGDPSGDTLRPDPPGDDEGPDEGGDDSSGDDSDGAGIVDRNGCGCRTGPDDPMLLLLVLAAGGLARRRRARTGAPCS